MQELSLITVLSRGNLILASANVIIAFSLLAYLLTHNFRNAVARSFCALLAFVTVVYVGDVFLATVDSLESALFWLKFQWLGIAFVPAAYLHFSDALLRTTNALSRLRRNAFRASYFVSLLFLLAVVFTDWLVWDGVYSPWAVHFQAGPLFWAFAAYFFLISAWGAVNVYRTRRRCLTSTSRRRMTYVTVSVAAPLSVFPYLLVASFLSPLSTSPLLFLSLAAMASVGIALMTVVMAYGVAYHGVLMPDRVVKRSLIKYLIQGPLLGICVIGLMLLVPQVERILGLPRDTVLIFAVVVGIVLFQILITLIQPLIDLLVYQGDRAEVTWLRRLDERLLTSTDLRQLLENILTAICDLLRVKTGFVMVMREGQLHIDTFCGSRAAALSFLRSFDPAALTAINAANGQDGEFVYKDGFWLLPLRAHGEEATLGILGVEARAELAEVLTEEERELIGALVERAETALEDRRLQQGVFGLLKQITPEIESLQRWRGTMPYAGLPALEPIEDSPIYSPDFTQWVKDALAHYWGGPRLTESPLLRLRVVREALRQHDYNPAKAMRAVLERAIEALRPAGERSLTASEWVLYNILELRFIKGQKVKEIAPRLAMSESDLYR
ncbi:MAG TPA: hypothetical protein EYP55_02110, partial [Anaerolineae bacterium]|nr:hypothetical protein [Anaerolineae bacterium]